jgi:hypothetical protein
VADGEASEAEVEGLLSRHFDELKLVIIYIDGMVFGDHVMIGAVGVDAEGHPACVAHPIEMLLKKPHASAKSQKAKKKRSA